MLTLEERARLSETAPNWLICGLVGSVERAIAIAPASFDMYVRNRVPWMRQEDHAHMLEGLRKAGWEE